MIDDAGRWVIPVFPDEEIPHILTAMLRCLEGLRKTNPQELETSLTKRLRKRLLQDPYLRDGPVWLDREAVLDHEDADDEGRLDLRFLLLDRHQKPPPYFAVEAKRLHVTSKGHWRSRVPEYVTHRQGMMCFIEGRYSKELRSGGMLGYVFDGDVSRAASSISEHLVSHQSQLKSVQPHLLNRASDFPTDTVWTTIHTVDGHPFTLFHILTEV